jgi:hypothetical protein
MQTTDQIISDMIAERRAVLERVVASLDERPIRQTIELSRSDALTVQAALTFVIEKLNA